MGSGDPELSLRLAQMEDEINAKRAEIMALKDQVIPAMLAIVGCVSLYLLILL